jgi:N-acetylmuramoyl-L-alanine amidase
LTKIYLDAGHGGKDPGAVGNGLYEKNLTLAIAQKIEKALKTNYENVEVLTSRTSDVYLTLDQRTDKANTWKADVFLSVHINSSTNVQAKGFSTYVYPNVDARTVSLQNVLHAEVFRAVSGYKVTDLGKKQADFHVLRETNMIAILSENFFISSVSDTALLKQDAFIQRIADGHVLGLEKFFGLKKKVVSPPPTPPPTSDTLYQVIVGTFKSRENAEQQVAKLKADGYESYIQVK